MNQYLNGTVIIGILAGFGMTMLTRVREMLSQLNGLVFDRVVLSDGQSVRLVANYLFIKTKKPLGSRRHVAITNIYDKDPGIFRNVVYEFFGRDAGVFWFDHRPVYITFTGAEKATLITIRKLADLNTILTRMAGFDDERYTKRSTERQHRFYTKTFTGRGGLIDYTDFKRNESGATGAKVDGVMPPASPNPVESRPSELAPSPGDPTNFTEGRLVPINIKAENISRWIPAKTMTSLVLPPSAIAMADEVARFLKSADWYKKRNIPYTMGMNLIGGPGTGKTSFLRALASDNGIPALSIDIATMSNTELTESFQAAAQDAPCLVIFEDLDAVFDGRVNKNPANIRNAVTFDCFLKCLDGIDGCHGVIKAATTNHPETMDPALGITTGEEGVSSRPGRFDVTINFVAPDASGRRQLASQILTDCPWEIDQMVDATDGQSPAQIQYRCTQLALDYFWGRKSRPIQRSTDATDQAVYRLQEAIVQMDVVGLPGVG